MCFTAQILGKDLPRLKTEARHIYSEAAGGLGRDPELITEDEGVGNDVDVDDDYDNEPDGAVEELKLATAWVGGGARLNIGPLFWQIAK